MIVLWRQLIALSEGHAEWDFFVEFRYKVTTLLKLEGR